MNKDMAREYAQSILDDMRAIFGDINSQTHYFSIVTLEARPRHPPDLFEDMMSQLEDILGAAGLTLKDIGSSVVELSLLYNDCL